MREILFRGKLISSGEWAEGFYTIDTMIREENTYLAHIISAVPKGIYDHNSWEVIPETVEQFTGLTDKNGKKIYEGDIVKAFDCIYVTYVVMWDSVRAMFYLRDHISRVTSDFYNYFGSNLVVIGNIHDNPSLLNVAAKGIASDAYAGGLAPATAEVIK